MSASLSHACHHSATQPLTAFPQEPLGYVKETLMSPLPSCLSGASLSRLKMPNPSGPEYMVSASPSLRALVILLYPRSTWSMPHFKRVSVTPPSIPTGRLESTFYPLIQWVRIKFLLVHILCLGLTQIHMYFVAWYFLLLSHGSQSFAFAIVCLALYIHF